MKGKNLTLHKSPKRKREDTDPQRRRISTSPSASHSTASQQDSVADDASIGVGANSPLPSVSGQLQNLDIRGKENQVIRPLFAKHGAGNDQQTGKVVQSAHPPRNNAPKATTPEPKTAKPQKQLNEKDSKPATTPSPQRKLKASPRQKPNKTRSKSPPLAGHPEENPLTWHDSEITGYNPEDPDDDGYGINGIGFRPTAAMAWDRLQKRNKQVEEWKSREAKEARDKRRERRVAPVEETISIPAGSPKGNKRVKFDMKAMTA
ncbi:hypothetical protein AJ80_04408 [Polytolypa hystricis UAMH7299]|uniref:Uncharacterized protein n=1 Tax=Polytolypa hystricis (strain UAMH7299) TaxID=1447883 RepID=A0A2B7YBT2_POLH7|nr:hypothetical protein AJ80_04408 [Polytolypa hystricis UAMH7299]